MEIVTLGPDDWELLKSVRLQALRDAQAAFLSSVDVEALSSEGEWRARFENSIWVVARDGDDIVGLARSLRVADRPASERHVESVWVAPRHRRSGMTRTLVQQLAELERRAGVTELRVWVIRGNDSARRAYLRLGFESTGEVKQLDDGSARVEERLRRWIGLAPEAGS
jgi:L-amino acid N-acyltransferase YncA